ncbi:uncharacterized protein LOC130138514 [Syzygium oleosum]|uniref:uncharacterized protein LOC130138514 n=1 Tax=Syzygium oleosum TaxID=219896 RepID=UPI0024BB3517|nr:uncharacterized protein LOC130138514 [Syzygium oleosum]
MQCPYDASSFLIAWARLSMLGTVPHVPGSGGRGLEELPDHSSSEQQSGCPYDPGRCAGATQSAMTVDSGLLSFWILILALLDQFDKLQKEVKKFLKKMAAASNDTSNHQSHCTICLGGLAVRTTVTLRCRHTFHLAVSVLFPGDESFLPFAIVSYSDCLGSVFNAGNAMRCPVCQVLEEGVWRSFPTRAPRRCRAGARVVQEDVQEPPVRMPPPSGIYFLDQGSAGSLFGHLAGASPGGQSMNLPSSPARAMMPAANNRSSSSGLLPAEQTAFQAEGSGTVNIESPDIGEVVLALSADVPPVDGIDGSEDIMSDGEQSVEDLSE